MAKNCLSFSTTSSLQRHACFSFCSADSKLSGTGWGGELASGGNLWLQEFLAVFTGTEALMAAAPPSSGQLAAHPASLWETCHLPLKLRWLPALHVNGGCVYLDRCSLCCFSAVRESSDCRNGMCRSQTKRRKRSQENLCKPF